MPRRRVAITGLGLISPIGLDVPQHLHSLRAARSGIRRVQAPPIRKEFAAGAVPERFEEHFTKLELPFLDRCQQLAILAARQASDAAGIGDYEAYGQRAGVYYSNINGGTATIMGWFDDLLIKGKQASRPFTAMAIMHPDNPVARKSVGRFLAAMKDVCVRIADIGHWGRVA